MKEDKEEDAMVRACFYSEGISCPKCKCHMSKVLHTRRVGENLVRERRCLGCGFEFKTVETS